MEEQKWVGISKSLWSYVTPMLGMLVASNPKLTGLDTLANTVVAAALGIAGGVLQFLHQRQKGNTILPG